ncbi:MAG TPA: cytochrome d ubiquinol oxidase subunit II, partial [Bacteroidales bacterium]|nr:cytochrome d ubiquinol oxidase subunit II [Bacteroidales bacterium]
HGLEALANPVNLSLGLAVLFLARVLGLMYLANSIDEDDLISRIKKALARNSIPFLVFFLSFVAFLVFGKGYMADSATGEVSLVKQHYLHLLLSHIGIMTLFTAGVILVLISLYQGIFLNLNKAIWYAGFGTVAVVMALFFLAGYGDSSFYPSSTDLQSSLTLVKASSSHFTLRTMFYVSFIIPFVLVYIWIAWRSLNRNKITAEEMTDGEHLY